MTDLLFIAKQILKENENAFLTGTLMLRLRGINLGREPKDIDIISGDYAPRINIPKELNPQELGHSSDGSGIKYKIGDILIDVMSGGEKPEIIGGLKLGTVEELMKHKYNYSKQGNPQSKKHHEDLIKLGFVFPETSEDNDPDLPF